MPYKIEPEAIVATQLTIAAVTLLPFYMYDGIAKDQYRIGPLLGMLGLGVFGSGFAYLWNFKVLEIAGPAIASSVTYITPLVAVVVGVIFLGERIAWYEPVGAVIVLLGAAIAQERISLKRFTSSN
jgi:drug/metabolite transporter (DMT)-like permease